jgi:hypothetical protein
MLGPICFLCHFHEKSVKDDVTDRGSPFPFQSLPA